MNTELTEEEMRRALFGSAEAPAPAHAPHTREEAPAIVIVPPPAAAKRQVRKPVTPKLQVTLRVGNQFEGNTEVFTYEADTLSTLQAELDATRAARKKYKYVEVVSVKPSK
uniref:hypothetical protein n=1 Tax=Pseudomonas fluorescens TaxID=294 RepID=UPI0020B1A3A7|nr:hypothetical protein [Pseudomonas fluorescens]